MQASAEKIWANAQTTLRTMLNADIYNLWFVPVRAVSLDGELLTLEVANDFCEVWLKDNYLGLLRDVLAHASGQSLKEKFIVKKAALHPPVPSADRTADDSVLPPDAPKTKSAKSDTEFIERSAVQ